METQGGKSVAESSLTMALCLICQTQEQQKQAHTQQTQAILGYGRTSGGDRASMRELLRQTAANLTSGEDAAGVPGPAAGADRPLTISLPKMTPGDEVEAVLVVFQSTAAGVCVASVGRAPPSPADGERALHLARFTGGHPLVLHSASLSPGGPVSASAPWTSGGAPHSSGPECAHCGWLGHGQCK